MWGLTEQEEKTVLRNLKAFEEEKLDPQDYETEGLLFANPEFHFYYNTASQARIFNDVITLKNPGNILIKLTISHAIGTLLI